MSVALGVVFDHERLGFHAVRSVGPPEAELRTINLGDSGFLLCRLLPPPDDDDSASVSRASGSEEDDEVALKWQVVYEAPHQSHYFNCPYQLGFNNGDLVGSLWVFGSLERWRCLI